MALGLLLFSAAAIGNFLVSQIRHASNNHLQTKAYALAENELEAMRMLRYGDIGSASKTVAAGGVRYAVDTQVVADTPAEGLKSIRVEVSWDDPQGPRNVSVHTIYTEVRRF